MKKLGILNSHISSVLSDLGHTDMIAIADCGLPIPDNVIKIDISLKYGSPSYLETLKEVLKDMKVEEVIMAEEIKEKNSKIHFYTKEELMQEDIKEDNINYVSHEEFKKIIPEVKAVIRTGENTPYANIILKSGVVF